VIFYEPLNYKASNGFSLKKTFDTKTRMCIRTLSTNKKCQVLYNELEA